MKRKVTKLSHSLLVMHMMILVSLSVGRAFCNLMLSVIVLPISTSFLQFSSMLIVYIALLIALHLRIRRERPRIDISRTLLVLLLVIALTLLIMGPLLIKWIALGVAFSGSQLLLRFICQAIAGVAVIIISIWLVESRKSQEEN